uniref:Uncharacterized protein n=1 Tax=Trypanosoma congolense (strain IL3000) TaxID=1068625 RepID=G0V0A9_TRYCI|nr:conserved hypothetical protein [Trypanosoma congolense IL3000]
MVKKGRKKVTAPQLVAPEPLADELEADMLWDYIKEVDDKPPFLDGTHVDATRAAFKTDRVSHIGTDAHKNFFTLRERNHDFVRARERFVMSESELKRQMSAHKCLKDEEQCFISLKQSEEEEYNRDRESSKANILALKKALAEEQVQLLEEMEEEAEDFFEKWGATLEDVTALAVGDSEVNAAFEEKQRLCKMCSDAQEQYFHDHGVHVVSMQKMREETKRQQDEMLQSMVARLGAGVAEMGRLSVEELEDKAAQQEETTRLISELMKVQGKSTVLEKETLAIGECRATLQRLIDLEVQKQQLCISRQKQIEADLKTLSEEVKRNNGQLLVMASNAAPTPAYMNLSGIIPASPNTITNVIEGQEQGLLLETVEAKRHLETLNVEMNNLKNELDTLRRRYITHLSGKYKPSHANNPLTKPGMCSELDTATKCAIRAAVLESLTQVCKCLASVDGTNEPGDPMERLLAVTDPEERRMVQDYVSRCVGKLFDPTCPMALLAPFPRGAGNAPSEV